MGTKTATRILSLAVAAGVLAPGLHRGPEPATVAVRPGISVAAAGREHVQLVRWAAERFQAAGLDAPAVEVHFHPDTSGCYGHLGSELAGRVDVCLVLLNETMRETLLHEMGHAWIDQHVTDAVRERFLEQRRLRAWSETDVEWDDRGYEHGAEIIAWGLGNRFLAPTIPDRDPARLRSAWEVLTGVAVPVPAAR